MQGWLDSGPSQGCRHVRGGNCTGHSRERGSLVPALALKVRRPLAAELACSGGRKVISGRDNSQDSPAMTHNLSR
eukprot:scaffold1460_cov417-Prasinococcus_capsulatus_cf.AAC.1